jgi:hypothetical protein
MHSVRNGSRFLRQHFCHSIFRRNARRTFLKPAWAVARIFCSFFSQEIVMAASRKILRILRLAFTSPAIVALLSAGSAFAAQGPGGGPGTASRFTQLAMAIIVYGTLALVVGSGLIGAARRR